MTRPIVSDFWNRSCISQDTKASHWFDAKCEGRTLPEHEQPAPVVDQLSGDLLCPMCGEPLEIIIDRTEYGPEFAGKCAACVTLVEIGE